jgi:branched-chain amino acid transport system permease protein
MAATVPRQRIRLPGLPRQPLARHATVGAIAVVVLYVLVNRLSPYHDFEVSEIAAFLAAVAGLTLLTGINGQLSLGHGALMAVGAYTAALVMIHTHVPLAVMLVLAVLGTALFGALVGVAAARLRGPYLAGATLALAIGLPELATLSPHTLGGPTGLSVPPPTPPASLGSSFPPQRWIAYICLLAVIVAMVLLANLVTSRYGRMFAAVRDDEIAAELAGIPVARIQVLAFVVSAGAAGLGGALLALVITVVNPAGFTLTLSIELVVAIVIGGLGSLAGASGGSILIVYLPLWATSVSKHLHLSTKVGSNLPSAAYGVVLIVVILAFPGGIQAALRGLQRRLPVRRPREGDDAGRGGASGTFDERVDRAVRTTEPATGPS